jgi:uncharacterized membrane protein
LNSLGYRESAPPEPGLAPTWPRVIGVVASAVVILNILIIFRGPLPWLAAVAGFLLAIGLPAWMFSQKVDWKTDSPSERLGYSVAAAILGLMLTGLLINTALPHIGISRPLDRNPVLVTVDVWCAGLAAWRPERFVPSLPRPQIDKVQGVDWAVGLLSALCVPLAILGANRLNNGAGNSLTFTMLCIATVTFIVIFVKRDALSPGTITAAIFFISLAMLLMTSLRGWYITGHDIQGEYKVFQLTKTNGDWNISNFQDAYNACLSLTILPTMLWQLMRINDPYIYKFWFQLLFALCPVFVYRISLRYTSRGLALIAVIYFISFPTFFTDMPFLNRQEIAYLFVAAIVTMATDPKISPKSVRITIAIFSIGVVLSHYSTSYVFLGTILLGYIVHKLLARLRRRRVNESERRSPVRRRPMIPTVSLLNVGVLLLGILLWNGLATHTVSGFGTVLSQALESLRGGSDSGKSGAVSYSLLGGGGTQSPAQALALYTKQSLASTGTAAQRAAAGFYSPATLNKFPLTSLPQANLPLTSAGKLLANAGLDPTTLNAVIRSGIARLLQLFVVIGLFSAVRRAWKRSSGWMAELIALASGALIIVALQVVLPGISADYGVLRAFQQAMISFGPLIAVGSLAIFRFLPEKFSLGAAFTVAIVFFVSLVGVLPQALGGYPAQLNLNNSGSYYDIYYTHPQDISAVQWLQSRISTGATGKPQPEVQIDPFVFQELQTFSTLNLYPVNFPALLQRNAYVFLGYQTVTGGEEATADINDDLINYNYPTALLNSTDNLVYSSNGSRIYGQSVATG